MFSGYIEPRNIVMDPDAIIKIEPQLAAQVRALSGYRLDRLPFLGAEQRTPDQNSMVTAARLAQAARLARQRYEAEAREYHD